MPKYTFTDSESIGILPAGDYIAVVESAENGISKGAKTRGSETIELKCRIENKGNKIKETLTFHESTAWKIDTILKALGYKFPKNHAVEVTLDMLVGRRGFVHVIQEKYTSSQTQEEKTVNKIDKWLCGKPIDHIVSAPTAATPAAPEATVDPEWS